MINQAYGPAIGLAQAGALDAWGADSPSPLRKAARSSGPALCQTSISMLYLHRKPLHIGFGAKYLLDAWRRFMS